jgi:hypothetical protein
MSQGPVHFSLPDAGRTKISVFDCLEREIDLVLNKNLGAGEHTCHYEQSETGYLLPAYKT